MLVLVVVLLGPNIYDVQTSVTYWLFIGTKCKLMLDGEN